MCGVVWYVVYELQVVHAHAMSCEGVMLVLVCVYEL